MLTVEEATSAALDEFYEFGLIEGEAEVIKSGKEATAYLCKGTAELGHEFAVAKVYHERAHRNFKAASVYQEGRVILEGQVRRAVENHSGFGRQAEEAMWVDHEFEWLSALEYAGVDVPAPYYSNEHAVLMEFIGDEAGPAPQLQHAHLDSHATEELFKRLLGDVARMLGANCVHGDLSAFNVLYHQGRAVIIDLPQCVDPRFSTNARAMLERDIANLGRFFRRFGLSVDAHALAEDLWRRFQRGEL